MTPEIKTKLLEIITSAQQVGGDIYAYVQREAPELAREVVVSAGIDAAGELTWHSLAAMALIAAAVWCGREYKNIKRDEDGTGYFMGIVLTSVAAVIAIGCLIGDVQVLIKCKYAPRIVFLQQVSKLIN
jgi:hypothetical protein